MHVFANNLNLISPVIISPLNSSSGQLFLQPLIQDAPTIPVSKHIQNWTQLLPRPGPPPGFPDLVKNTTTHPAAGTKMLGTLLPPPSSSYHQSDTKASSFYNLNHKISSSPLCLLSLDAPQHSIDPCKVSLVPLNLLFPCSNPCSSLQLERPFKNATFSFNSFADRPSIGLYFKKN